MGCVKCATGVTSPNSVGNFLGCAALATVANKDAPTLTA